MTHARPGVAEYEHKGELADPGFRSFDTATGLTRSGDDLRLRVTPKSPAEDTAVKLPDDL